MDKGNTVIVIEHNLDVIKTSDWIVDMGPEGGAGGGTVVAEGTPEDVAANTDSYTGHFLAEALGVPRPTPKKRASAARSAPSFRTRLRLWSVAQRVVSRPCREPW